MQKNRFVFIVVVCVVSLLNAHSSTPLVSEDAMQHCLLVDYPVLESNDLSEYLIQNLPELELLHPAWRDTLQALIRTLPPLQDGESYKLRYEYKDYIGLRLILSRGENLSSQKLLQKMDFRFGSFEIDNHKIPLEFPITYWMSLRNLSYDVLKKKGNFCEIRTRKGNANEQHNECYIFKIADDNSKLVFDKKETR